MTTDIQQSLVVSPGWNHRGPVVTVTSSEENEPDHEHRLKMQELEVLITELQHARDRAMVMFIKNTRRKKL